MASAFLQGFTGGMGAMNQMIGGREDRAIRREQMDLDRQRMEKSDARQDQKWDMQMKEYENQQKNYKAAAMMHGYGKMNPEQQAEWRGSVADRLNQDPDLQNMLSRNVSHDEQKRISPNLGSFTKDGFVPEIEVFNGKTGEVIRTGPLTEFGKSDGSDSSLAMSNEDLMQTMGEYFGHDDFITNLEMDILSRGGQLPSKTDKDQDFKTDTWTDSETGNRFRTYMEGGKKMVMMTSPNGATSSSEIGAGTDLNELFAGMGGDGDEKPKPGAVVPNPDKQPKPEEAVEGENKTGFLKGMQSYLGNIWEAGSKGREQYKSTHEDTRNPVSKGFQKHMAKSWEAGSQHRDKVADRQGSKEPDNQTHVDVGQVEMAQMDLQKMNEAGASKEEIEQYLKQLDPSIVRKITQNEINSGNLVAKGMQ